MKVHYHRPTLRTLSLSIAAMLCMSLPHAGCHRMQGGIEAPDTQNDGGSADETPAPEEKEPSGPEMPRVTLTCPSGSINPRMAVKVAFSAPVDEASPGTNFFILDITGKSYEPGMIAERIDSQAIHLQWASDGSSVSINAPFPYCRQFAVELHPPAMTAAGEEIGTIASCTFQTGLNPLNFDGDAACTADVAFRDPFLERILIFQGEKLIGSPAPMNVMPDPQQPNAWLFAYAGQKTIEVNPKNLGDLTGSGKATIAVAARDQTNAWKLLSWKYQGILSTTPHELETDTQDLIDMQVSAAGDVNGDGVGDLFITELEEDPNTLAHSSTWTLLSGAAPAIGNLQTSQLSLADIHFQFGIGGTDRLGDFDGDGYDDLLASLVIGQNYEDELRLFFGRPSASTLFSHAAVVTAKKYYHFNRALGGDLNGDGIADLIAAHYLDGGYDPSALIFFGKSGDRSDREALDASVTINHGALAGNDFWQIAVPGDIDADGREDLIILSRNDMTGGKAFIFRGRDTASWISSVDIGEADLIISGLSSDERLMDVRSVGDVDNDGYDDFIVALVTPSTNARGNLLFLGGPKIFASKQIVSAQAASFLTFTP